MEKLNRIVVPRWLQVVLVPIALFACIWLFRQAAPVITVFIIGTALAFALDPLVRRLETIGSPRWLAVLVVFLVFILIIVALLSWAIPYLVFEIRHLIDNVGKYNDQINVLYKDAVATFEAMVDPSYRTKLTEIDIMPKIEATVTSLLSGLLGFGVDAVSVLLDSILVAVIAVWMLLDMPNIRKRIAALYPAKYAIQVTDLIGDLKLAMIGYLKGQAILSLVIGVPVGLAMAIMGLPYAVLLGLWAALTELIPYLGPFLGAAPCAIIAFFDSPTKALAVIILFAVIQQAESLYLAPRIMGDKLGVHPLIVMFALIAGGKIAGIPGMILSAPVVAIGKVLIDFWRQHMSLARWSLRGDKGNLLDQLSSD